MSSSSRRWSSLFCLLSMWKDKKRLTSNEKPQSLSFYTFHKVISLLTGFLSSHRWREASLDRWQESEIFLYEGIPNVEHSSSSSNNNNSDKLHWQRCITKCCASCFFSPLLSHFSRQRSRQVIHSTPRRSPSYQCGHCADQRTGWAVALSSSYGMSVE